MSNHTPGPWRAVFGGSIGHYSVNERVFQLYNRLDLSDMDSFRDWDSAFDEAQSKVKTALAKVRGEE